MAETPDRPSWPLARPAYATLAAAVQGESARWNVPGIAVAACHNGELAETAAGVASIATRMPLVPDALFQIGSISKVFATTLAMTLVDEGKLDLDVPVITYVPDLPLTDPDARGTITTRHLLSHASGLEGDRFANYGRGDDASARAVANFGVLEQWVPPGTLFAYCNTGFYLVGRICEILTGQTFEQALQERVLAPWGLEHTVLFAEDAIARPHAVGQNLRSREEGFAIARPYWNRRHATAAGGVLSTVGDLVRFARAHLAGGELDGNRVLSAASARAMREEQIAVGPGDATFGSAYGLGWSLKTQDGVQRIGHGGATDGFRAQLTAVPEKGFVLAMLTNADTGTSAMQEIEAWALEHYLGIPEQAPSPIALSAAELDAYAGSFNRFNQQTVLTRDGDGLHARITSFDSETGTPLGSRTMRLVPVIAPEARAFRVADGPFQGAIVQFFDAPTAADPARLLMRASGRLSARSGVPEKRRRREKALA
ncbi:MAG TPA: serine hydrolase domain-containing protein [Thermomicrobiales bacterium]|nr:serine hydrolase domain-containing protein [Thermomicrobiales bacterium]